MKPGLSLDVASAVVLLRHAFVEREAGRSPLPDLTRSRAMFASADLADALEMALEAIVRLTWDDPDEITSALWVDDELDAELDEFAGVEGQ